MEASPTQPFVQTRPRYAVLITKHARERWLERIADPQRYEHLGKCRASGCCECAEKARDIVNIIAAYGRQIDGEIARRVREARAAKSLVKDANFMAAIKKRYGEEQVFEFLQDHSAVFVIVHPTNEPTPVLKTVMSLDMIDGMVFQVFRHDNMAPVFSRWKHERRMAGSR